MLSGGADIGTLIRSPDGRVPRILGGTADPDLRDRLRRVLGSAGCQVETAADPTAIVAALAEPPDLVVADLAIAEPQDFALLRRLRRGAAAHWLPIILLGAENTGAVRQSAFEAGADDWLTKPFGARDLLSRVGLLLAMARVGREASEAVRASERRLADVLAAIGEAVFAIDRDERFLFANRKALEFWRRPTHEIIGRKLLEVFPEIADSEAYRTYRRVLETGEPWHVETRGLAVGGRWIGLDVHPAPDSGLVVAFRDIDVRKRAETRLRNSEERFRLMLEASPDIAFIIRPDGNAEYYNQQLRAYAGAPIGPLPTDRLALHPPEDRDAVERARAYGFAAGTEFTVEARMRRHDGVYRWHRIRNRPVRIDGEIAFWLGTAVDIDDMREANELLERRVAERTAELEAANRHLAAQVEEREKAEDQLRRAQRIEAVGQLTSGVAHDFNNLLTAIIGNLELLEARLSKRDARGGQLAAAAIAAAERGSRLTTQLLAFSRQQRMTPEPVDLNQIVGSMRALLHSTIGATTRIETVLTADLWPALADSSQIELVLLNLAINARDAMASGGVITIRTENLTRGRPERPEEPPPGDYAIVSVADTGCGILPAILDKVFDPFFTTKEVGKGSGLGLSQVLGVAQQLGGGVSIVTRPGEGTIVKVYLPRARVGHPAEHRTGVRGPRPVLPGEDHSDGLILLVDDDSDVRAVAAAMLETAGYEILEAGSGDSALNCLERERGRIVLMIADIAMPGMNGIDLAHAAQRLRPDLPVLFVTGFAGAALPVEEFGPDLLLRKPFRAAELIARVGAVLDHQTRSGPLARLNG